MKCPDCYSVNFDLINDEIYYCSACGETFSLLEIEKLFDFNYDYIHEGEDD